MSLKTERGAAFERILYAAASAFFLAAVLLDLFFSNIPYQYKKVFPLPEPALLLAGLAAAAVLFLLLRRVPEKAGRPILLASVLLFGLEYLVVSRIFFYTRSWDAFLVFDSAEFAARGMPGEAWNEYLSKNPNNLLITLLYTAFCRICYTFGLTDTAGVLFYLVLVQCVFVTLGGAVLFCILRDLSDEGTAFAGWAAYALLAGLSGWICVAYTDMAALLFPLLILRVYQLHVKSGGAHEIRDFVLIGFLSYWGYRIKPTVLIVLIAVVLSELLGLWGDFSRERLMRFFRMLLIFGAGTVLYSLVFRLMVSTSGLRIDRELENGPLHMIMMGLNPESDGGYNVQDVLLADGLPGKQERRAAELSVIRERLAAFGPAGLLRHLFRKMLVIFNDGSFAFAQEGGFFDVTFPPAGKTGELLKSLYYPGGGGSAALLGIEQAAWLAVLFLSSGAAFLEKDRIRTALVLSLLGIAAFTLIFEARSRYLLVFAPLFIIAAFLVLKKILSFVRFS